MRLNALVRPIIAIILLGGALACGSNGAPQSVTSNPTTTDGGDPDGTSTDGDHDSAPTCPATPMTTVDVGPTRDFKRPSQAIACLAPGFVMNIDAGHYSDTFDIPPGLDGFTITGAGADATILDGSGGCPASHNDQTNGCSTRLAWGKGIIHTRSAGTISDMTLQNGGANADTNGDGQAGLYIESFATRGQLHVSRVYFLLNENGIFAPHTGGENIELVVDSCDFVANGQGGNGYAHDMYAQSATVTVSDSNFYGNPYGNNLKSRSTYLSVSGGYNASDAGRWIDMPDGGNVSVHGGTYTQVIGDQANVIGFAEESQKNGIGTFTVEGATVILARYNSQFMIPTGGTIAFSNTAQHWSNDDGTSPSITVLNGGTLTGLATSPSGTFVSLPAPPAPSSGATFTTKLK